MKIIFHIAHPSQFYIFRNVINNISNNHSIIITYTKKDVLEDLIKDSEHSTISYPVEAKKYSGFNYVSQLINFLNKEKGFAKIVKNFKPDLIIGTSVVIAHISKLFKTKSIILNEDDFDIIKKSANLGYSFVDHIISPKIVRTGKWKNKVIGYNGYQKLTYLHPSIFNSNESEINHLLNLEKDFSLLRFSSLKAHHDTGIKGLEIDIIRKLISKLLQIGEVYISSEIDLPDDLQKYKLKIPPKYIHTILKHSKILISDSQSMSMEAAMLGTPSIRFNDFVGRISVLNELEEIYGLTFGIKPTNTKLLFSKTDFLLNQPDIKTLFKERRDKMINDKIDVLSFFCWLIDNYPQSLNIIKQNTCFIDREFKE